MWKAIFQNKLTIYKANLPSFVQKIIKSRCYVDLSRRLWQKSHPKMAAWERLIQHEMTHMCRIKFRCDIIIIIAYNFGACLNFWKVSQLTLIPSRSGHFHLRLTFVFPTFGERNSFNTCLKRKELSMDFIVGRGPLAKIISLRGNPLGNIFTVVQCIVSYMLDYHKKFPSKKLAKHRENGWSVIILY
jgi:hypothetical protein